MLNSRICVCEKLSESVTQMCLALCDLMDHNLPSSSVHGILQARILGWVAIPFCRGSSWPRIQTCIFCIGRRILYQPRHLGTYICLRKDSKCSFPGDSPSASRWFLFSFIFLEMKMKSCITYSDFSCNCSFLFSAFLPSPFSFTCETIHIHH